jgi:O-antigen/teichoic acid export membrane protein
VNVIATFIISPIFVHNLGNVRYGVWEMLNSILGYMSILDLGITPAIVSYVAKFHAKKDYENVNSILMTATFLLLIVGLIAFFCLLFFAKFPGLLSKDTLNFLPEWPYIALLAGITLLIQFSSAAFTGYIIGTHNLVVLNFLRIFQSVANPLFAYFALRQEPGQALLLIVAFTLFTAIIVNTTVVFYSIKKGNLKLDVKYIRINQIKTILLFGFNSSLLMVSSRVISQAIPFLISSTIGISQIVYYVIVQRLCTYVRDIGNAIGLPLMPLFSAARSVEDNNKQLQNWVLFTRVMQIVLGVFILTCLFFGDTFIGIWMGNEYAIKGKYIIYVLIVGIFSDWLSPNSLRYLIGIGEHKAPAIVALVSSCILVLVAYLFVRLWGLVGIAAALSLYEIIKNSISLTMALKHLNVSFVIHFKLTTQKNIVPLTATALLMLGITSFLTIKTYIDLIIYVSLCSGVYFSIVYGYCFTPEERTSLGNGVKSIYYRARRL